MSLHEPRPPDVPRVAQSSAPSRVRERADSAVHRAEAEACVDVETVDRACVRESEDGQRAVHVAAMTRDRLRLADERIARRTLEDSELATREDTEQHSAHLFVLHDLLMAAERDTLEAQEDETYGRADLAAEELTARSIVEHAHVTQLFALASFSRTFDEIHILTERAQSARAEIEVAERIFKSNLCSLEREAWLRSRARELKQEEHTRRMGELNGAPADGFKIATDADAAPSLEEEMMAARRAQRRQEEAAEQRVLDEESARVLQMQRETLLLLEEERNGLQVHEDVRRLAVLNMEAQGFLTHALHPRQQHLLAMAEEWSRASLTDLRRTYVATCLQESYAVHSAALHRERRAFMKEQVSAERTEWLAARAAEGRRCDEERRLQEEEQLCARHARTAQDLQNSDAIFCYERAECDDRALLLSEERRLRDDCMNRYNASHKVAMMSSVQRKVEAEILASTLLFTADNWGILETHRVAREQAIIKDWRTGLSELQAVEVRGYITARSAEVKNEELPYTHLYVSSTPDTSVAAAEKRAEEVVARSASLKAATLECEKQSLEHMAGLRMQWEKEQYEVEMNRVDAARRLEEDELQRAAARCARERQINDAGDVDFVVQCETQARRQLLAQEGTALRRLVHTDTDVHNDATPTPTPAPTRPASAPPRKNSTLDDTDTLTTHAQVDLLIEAESAKRTLYHAMQQRHRDVIERGCNEAVLEVLFPHTASPADAFRVGRGGGGGCGGGAVPTEDWTASSALAAQQSLVTLTPPCPAFTGRAPPPNTPLQFGGRQDTFLPQFCEVGRDAPPPNTPLVPGSDLSQGTLTQSAFDDCVPGVAVHTAPQAPPPNTPSILCTPVKSTLKSRGSAFDEVIVGAIQGALPEVGGVLGTPSLSMHPPPNSPFVTAEPPGGAELTQSAFDACTSPPPSAHALSPGLNPARSAPPNSPLVFDSKGGGGGGGGFSQSAFDACTGRHGIANAPPSPCVANPVKELTQGAFDDVYRPGVGVGVDLCAPVDAAPPNTPLVMGGGGGGQSAAEVLQQQSSVLLGAVGLSAPPPNTPLVLGTQEPGVAEGAFTQSAFDACMASEALGGDLKAEQGRPPPNTPIITSSGVSLGGAGGGEEGVQTHLTQFAAPSPALCTTDPSASEVGLSDAQMNSLLAGMLNGQ